MDFFPPTNWCRISSTHSMVPEGVASPDPPERPGRFVAREKGNIDDLAEAQRITFHLAMGQCQNPLAFRFWRTFIPTGWWFLFIFEIIVFLSLFIFVFFLLFCLFFCLFLFIFWIICFFCSISWAGALFSSYCCSPPLLVESTRFRMASSGDELFIPWESSHIAWMTIAFHGKHPATSDNGTFWLVIDIPYLYPTKLYRHCYLH